MELDLILKTIDEASELGIEAIGFTGGDPFVRLSDLTECVRRCNLHDIKVVVVTSAFWASTELQARRILEQMADIYMLGISADVYHQQFTDISRVRNAIRAGKTLGIPRIEVQATYLDTSEVDDIKLRLGEDAEGIRIIGQRLWPVGQAASLVGSPTTLYPLNELSLECPTRGPVITTDGKMRGCCSSLLNLGERNPLTLGDVAKDGLPQVLDDAARNPYYRFVTTFGLQPLVEMVQKSAHSDGLKERYSDVCHLCHDLHANEDMRAFLLNSVSCSEVAS